MFSGLLSYMGNGPRGVVVLVGGCPRGNCPRGSCPQGSCPRGSCLKGSCPVTTTVLCQCTWVLDHAYMRQTSAVIRLPCTMLMIVSVHGSSDQIYCPALHLDLEAARFVHCLENIGDVSRIDSCDARPFCSDLIKLRYLFLVQSISENYWHNLKKIATEFFSAGMHSGEVSLKHTKNPLRHLWGKQAKSAIKVTFSYYFY